MAAFSEKASLAALSAGSGSSLIGFVQGGANAIPRPSQNKLREVVSVMDYGATGDGVTDDSAALTAALAAASGQAIYFPKGSYNVASMTPATGRCRLYAFGDATIIGFNWTELSAPRQDSAVTVSDTDAHFEAFGITFKGAGSTPGLTIKNQSQGNVIRSAAITNCVFRGQVGLVIDNAQGCQVVNCDFVQNQYGLKSLSATNNSFVNCNFYAPIIGVLIDTSASDTAARQGGENLKFTNCLWIDGVTAIKSLKHNYLWLSSCMIDYFNSGIYLQGSKFARLENTYIGCNDNSKSAMANYIAPTQLGCFYATGDAAASRSSGIEAINCEFLAYSPSSKPPMQLVGNGFAFTGIEEVDLDTCRFASDTATNTMTSLLTINTANDLYMAGNKFMSSLNNNVAAPWVLSNLLGGRFVFKDNDFANVTNSGGTAIAPATGDAGNEVFETAQVTLPTNGGSATNSVAFVYKQKYKSTPRVVAMVRSAPKPVELLNVSNTAQDSSQVYLIASTIDGSTMTTGGNVVVDVIVMGA